MGKRIVTDALFDLLWFTILVSANEPLLQVDTSLVLESLRVVVKRLTSSTNHVSRYPGSSGSGFPVMSTIYKNERSCQKQFSTG